MVVLVVGLTPLLSRLETVYAIGLENWPSKMIFRVRDFFFNFVLKNWPKAWEVNFVIFYKTHQKHIEDFDMSRLNNNQRIFLLGKAAARTNNRQRTTQPQHWNLGKRLR